jgi:hypothetical protein
MVPKDFPLNSTIPRGRRPFLCNFGIFRNSEYRNLKHVKDRATNLAERPQRVSSVTRITSTSRACANARNFLRSARSCFAPEAVSFQTSTTL